MEEIRKKSKFFTLLFSCYPGGGHMYLGFMKQGVQLMLLFSVIAAMASFHSIFNSLGFLVPILIAYSIFDAMHKRSSMAEPNDSDLELFKWFNIENTGKIKTMHYYKVGMYALIILGVYILIDNVGLNLIRGYLYSRYDYDQLDGFYLIERAIKSLILGSLFIIGGLKLRGKLKEANLDEEQEEGL